ncbi:uncharacterized protein MAM_05672 [Metarhizium album ARSEF 1941]|uniref:Uncharacterized protein n=1 Tax=Metarhizium album (strain ARSEF 1941) TaxID=1081103 RepID=A0A0B2WQU5_METAS|nr:uncharacterized protein MAM_05672 [Metarhizium album ARSEF 1941]KHN96383.1 hypothetical protein MAM_05672 [Metarhizium album ARSEF 1941]
MLRQRVLSVLVSALGGKVVADRPSDQSICDYYASQRYGASNDTTQLRLMQGIVAYAYAGGETLPNAAANSTGIFNTGQFNGYDVYLRPWFDGSRATTNLNDQAVGVNWLDGGGTQPLISFLNGSTQTAEIKSGTNQYTLFTHWYYVFGKIFGCSRYKGFVGTSFTPLTPAYVHKFMDLNQTEVGYFIEQFIAASRYYGFSDADASTLSTFMNARYNIRCSPPLDGQLYSICFAKECPLAAPNAECGAYSNVQPYGLAGSTSQGSGTPPPPPTTTTTPSSPTASTATPTTPAAAPSSLSGGAVAAAAGLLAAAMCLFFRRRRRADAATPPGPSMLDSTWSPAFSSQPAYSSNLRDSYSSQSPHAGVASAAADARPQAALASSSPPPPQELDTRNPAGGPAYYGKYAH